MNKLYPQISLEYNILWDSSLQTNISLEISHENRVIDPYSLIYFC